MSKVVACLISRLAGSGQEVDLTLPANCNGYGRVHHFRLATAQGWPANPLPIAPACRALGIAPVPDLMTALVFQNAACAWRCWYCFVPEELLKADIRPLGVVHGRELVELYRANPGSASDHRPLWRIAGPGAGMDTVDDASARRRRPRRNDLSLDGRQPQHDLSLRRLSRPPISLSAPLPQLWSRLLREGLRLPLVRLQHARRASADYDRQFEVLRRVLDLGSMSTAM